MNNTSLETGSAARNIETKIYGKAKNGVDMKIVLTKKETDICNLLKQVSDYIANERPDLPRIESRIAGGWVRDRVMFLKKKLKSDTHDKKCIYIYYFFFYFDKYIYTSIYSS